MQHNAKFTQWNADVQAAVSQMKMEFNNNLNSGWAQIVNKFSIHRFGLWNCGQKVEMMDELQINAKLFVKSFDIDLCLEAVKCLKQAFEVEKIDSLTFSVPAEVIFERKKKKSVLVCTIEHFLTIPTCF